MFGDLLERACGASLRGCALTRNALSGLLVRDGAAPAVADCTLTGNGEWGLSLLDAAGSYEGCEIGANARGSVAAWLPEEGVDTARLLAANRLDRPLQWVGPA